MYNQEGMAPILDEKKPNKAFAIIKKIFNILFTLAILGIAAVWIIDFILIKNDEDPMFCIEKNTHPYGDGTDVEECIGLGYKVYQYSSPSHQGHEFGPFFIEMRTADQQQEQ